jgi:hypothetical protein
MTRKRLSFLVKSMNEVWHAVCSTDFTMMTTAPTKPLLRKISSSLVALVVMAVGLTAGAGCAPVRPYERAKLAHPTMAAADLTGIAEAHIRGVNEGAVGGSGGGGSGCGCN